MWAEAQLNDYVDSFMNLRCQFELKTMRYKPGSVVNHHLSMPPTRPLGIPSPGIAACLTLLLTYTLLFRLGLVLDTSLVALAHG